jgi:hypothetical protein
VLRSLNAMRVDMSSRALMNRSPEMFLPRLVKWMIAVYSSCLGRRRRRRRSGEILLFQSMVAEGG